MCRCRRGKPQARFDEQRQDGFAEVREIGFKIEERELHAVASGALQRKQLVDDLLGRADQMQIAAENALLALVLRPRFASLRAAWPTNPSSAPSSACSTIASW